LRATSPLNTITYMNLAPAPAPAPSNDADNAARPPSRTMDPRGPRPQSKGPRRNASRGPRRGPPRSRDAAPAVKKGPDYLPLAPAGTGVRIIPLGGVEEVGRNMTMVEANGDIFIFDAGFQFVSEEAAPGVDYILPNTKYLEVNKDRVRAVIITHGHLDHIGGIPFMMPRFGNPPIYTQNLTAVMIAKRQEEYPEMPKLTIVEVEVGQSMTIGNTRVKFFPVTHSIPDAMGVSVETAQGNVVITGDLKLDHDNGEPTDAEKKVWGELAKDNNLFFIADSTNAEKDGFSIPERNVSRNLEDIIRTIKGRLIIGTLSSQFERMINIITVAESLGKKIITEGRSIKTNIEIAQRTNRLNIKRDTIIPAQAISDYPADKIVILTTGAQGEEFGALTRIATKQHKYIQFNERDTIILSSSVIPGNEIAVQRLKDNLFRYNLTLLHYRTSDVHSTGHGNTGELVWINKQVNAKFFMPAYGYHSMVRSHARAVEQAGRARDTIVVADNGTVIDVVEGQLIVHKDRVPNTPLVVDGFSIGDMQEVLVRDRKMLAKDGMFVIVATINLKTGRLRKSPDIISRGFIYLRESQDLLNQTRLLIKKVVEDTATRMNPVDLDEVKNVLSEQVATYLVSRTNKSPMVIPVLIGV
jgi:ribonuclease J